MNRPLKVTARVLPDERVIHTTGRIAWALLELHKAGPRGCTTVDYPACRLSAYVHFLKRENGLQIETRTEPHKGPFPGNHARYVLLSAVEILHRSDGQQATASGGTTR